VRKVLFGIVSLLFCVAFGFLVGYLAHMNDTVSTRIRLFVTPIRQETKRLVKGLQPCTDNEENSLAKLEIFLDEASTSILDSCKQAAVKKGKLTRDLKIEVPAIVIWKGDSIRASVRLKGDYPDHWITDKESLRIKVKGNNTVMGMKSFSIQTPETRRNLSEWYFYKFIKREGLIALRYDFVHVYQNGKFDGLFALEESFDKHLLENNQRREAPILKFDENVLVGGLKWSKSYTEQELFMAANIDLFKPNRTFKNEVLRKQFLEGQSLAEEWRLGNLSLGSAVNVDRAAKLFAIADITGSHHALRWKNVRLYFNPIEGKLEIIGYDGGGGNIMPSPYYFGWLNTQIGHYDLYAWKALFFENKEFVEAYLGYLEKFSETSYLRDFHAEIEKDMIVYQSEICNDQNGYTFDMSVYLQNADFAKTALKNHRVGRIDSVPNYLVKASLFKPFNEGDEELTIEVENHALKPVFIVGLFDKQDSLVSSPIYNKLNGRIDDARVGRELLSFSLTKPTSKKQTEFKVKNGVYVSKGLKVGFRNEGDTVTQYIRVNHPTVAPSSFSSEKNEAPCFKINDAKKSIEVLPGMWVLSKSVSLPFGYSTICAGFAEINLVNNALLQFRGPVSFTGTKEKHIIFKSDDKSGTVLVSDVKGQCKFKYVDFIELSDNFRGRTTLSGAVTIYNSNVVFEDVLFSSCKAEDALNLYSSVFELNNVTFSQTLSDALDSDYSTGNISNCTFVDIGNDALDFSGSKAKISGLLANRFGDKAISAGERSSIEVQKIQLEDGEIGLVSKDESKLIVNSGTIRNVRLGYAVFQKKSEYGAASLTLTDLVFNGVQQVSLVEEGSSLTVDGQVLEGATKNVAKSLYGNQFGIETK
jgi:hypothetical protein